MTIDVSAPDRELGADPLWLQAAAVLERQIESGALVPGSRLPAERELCATMAVSRVTLRRALNHLVQRGVVRPSHGRGWFVAQPPGAREWPNELESFSATARRKRMRPGASVLRQEVAPATLDESDRLDVAAGADLLHLERLRTLDDVRIAVDHAVLPLALVPDFPGIDFTDRSLFDEMRAAGIEPERAETAIEARAADHSLASNLGIDVGAPVLVLDETVLAADGRPVLWSTIRYSGERYRLRTTFTTAGS